MNRIIVPKGKKLTEGCSQLQNQKAHNLYCPPNIMRMTKSRRIMIKYVESKIHRKFASTT
jgi:hypothetical protein